MSKDNEIEFIVEFVKNYRKQNNIVPSVGYKAEMSAEARGEGYALLFGQLIYTPEGMNGWLELDVPQIRKLVVSEIENCKQ